MPFTPGWALTPVDASDASPFPTVVPLPTTKLAAVCCEDGSIHVFYQASDESIRELVFSSGQGWTGSEAGTDVVLEPGAAKQGTSLTAVAGGWCEKRLFCVTKTNQLLEVYSDDKLKWSACKSYLCGHVPLRSTRDEVQKLTSRFVFL